MESSAFIELAVYISYVAIGLLPYMYMIVVKKWPITQSTLIRSLLCILRLVIFTRLKNTYSKDIGLPIKEFAVLFISLITRTLGNNFPITNPLCKGNFNKIVQEIQKKVSAPPYYINNGIDLKSPKFFSWEPVTEPLKISKQKPTAIFVHYELATNDPNISLRHKDRTQKEINKNGCFLYLPEGYSVPLWLKYKKASEFVMDIFAIVGLAGLLEIILYRIDVKHFKVKKMLSSDPKAYKYSSIVFAEEQVIIVEE